MRSDRNAGSLDGRPDSRLCRRPGCRARIFIRSPGDRPTAHRKRSPGWAAAPLRSPPAFSTRRGCLDGLIHAESILQRHSCSSRGTLPRWTRPTARIVDFSSDSHPTRLPEVLRAVVELPRPDRRRSMERSVSTYQDAQLILKLYELRRDEKLREAREWFVHRFFQTKDEDVQAVMSSAGSDNVSVRMETSYWVLAYFL